MKIAIVIPARFASTRFPGKPLALVQGKPMIVRVAEKSRAAWPEAQVVVATDDERIRQAVEAAGFQVAMTRTDHPSGSDRIHEAATQLGLGADDLVVNVQGDEPQVRREWIEALIRPFQRDASLRMSTIAHDLGAEDLESPNAVKAIVNSKSHAIYFTRYAAPYSRQSFAEMGAGPVLKHMGFYAYRKGFLDEFCGTVPSYCERAESLEQLRALEMGERIFVTRVEGRSLGVDTPDDLVKLNEIWRDE
ncbi:MAG: 3-deoxy-manno-octulosonate cytidylyltransferase [Bdellovibrionaceae bacterium]|nr:3-deoxy-manno-octulosonate cytidylyltransferase [Pseudobdellovibrionaceae bacterium]